MDYNSGHVLDCCFSCALFILCFASYTFSHSGFIVYFFFFFLASKKLCLKMYTRRRRKKTQTFHSKTKIKSIYWVVNSTIMSPVSSSFILFYSSMPNDGIIRIFFFLGYHFISSGEVKTHRCSSEPLL